MNEPSLCDLLQLPSETPPRKVHKEYLIRIMELYLAGQKKQAAVLDRALNNYEFYHTELQRNSALDLVPYDQPSFERCMVVLGVVGVVTALSCTSAAIWGLYQFIN